MVLKKLIVDTLLMLAQLQNYTNTTIKDLLTRFNREDFQEINQLRLISNLRFSNETKRSN